MLILIYLYTSYILPGQETTAPTLIRCNQELNLCPYGPQYYLSPHGSWSYKRWSCWSSYKSSQWLHRSSAWSVYHKQPKQLLKTVILWICNRFVSTNISSFFSLVKLYCDVTVSLLWIRQGNSNEALTNKTTLPLYKQKNMKQFNVYIIFICISMATSRLLRFAYKETNFAQILTPTI